METKLYVGNLSYDVTKEDLQDAFVTMESKESAEVAMRALNGADWHGRALTVNEARARESRAAYCGGRGARRY